MSSRVILSVDVEDWYHGPTVINPQDPARSLQSILAGGKAVERAHSYIHTCLELFSRHRVKATFFWVAEYARRFPHLMRAVVGEGHEIACHGLWHGSKVNAKTKRSTYSRDEFRRITGEAKSIIEDQAGQSVVGYRAPNAYVSGVMIDVLEEMGFRYDSSVSVNSLYNKTDAVLRGVSTSPYYPRRGSLEKGSEPRSIVEFPWPYWNVLGFKLQTAGGPFLRIFGRRLICAGLRQSLRRGHTIFYFHPVDLCNEPIPMPFHWSRPFLWALKGDIIRQRVDRILGAFSDRAANFASILDGPLFQ